MGAPDEERTPKMAKRKAQPKPDSEHAGQLARLSALAHPLRFKLFQEFVGSRRTTHQVAAILGLPPTRLYHHVNALERVGLLRLVETRPNRGTVEKYFEAAPAKVNPQRRKAPTGSPAVRRLQAALATTVFDEARLELLAAIAAYADRSSGKRSEDEAMSVVRVLLAGSSADLVRLRKKILDLIRRHARAQKQKGGKGAAGAPEDGDCWSLTLAFLPRRARERR